MTCWSLRAPTSSNRSGLEADDRPGFFSDLLPQLAEMRSRTGRPHLILIDDGHQLLPAASGPAAVALPRSPPATVYVTVHPDQMSREALSGVGVLIAVGDKAGDVMARFCQAVGAERPPLPDFAGPAVGALLDRSGGPAWLRPSGPAPPGAQAPHPYAEGTPGEDKSFYFRGPEWALHLRAYNLTLLLQLADGSPSPPGCTT